MQTRRKKLFRTTGAALLFLILSGLFFTCEFVAIGTAYKAKQLCSEVFVGGRKIDAVLQTDLSSDTHPLMGLIDATVDRSRQNASAGFFGLVRREADFRQGFGCTLQPPKDYPALSQPKLPMMPAAQPMQSPLKSAPDPSLNTVLDWAFAEPANGHARMTRAIVILHNGKIVAERYAPGFDADTPMIGWSMTKSVISALVGILAQEGKMVLDAPADIAEWQKPDDPRRAITLRELLHMSGGLKFGENYLNPFSDVMKMLLGEPDKAAFAANHPLAAAPGTLWRYSSGTTLIISRMIRNVLGDADYFTFPRKTLFAPLGMPHALIEPDASGTFVGSSYMYATAREWAAFGQLYCRNGIWEGKRILPEGWVDFSTTPAPQAPGGNYGAHFWLKIPDNYRSKSKKSLPADAFHAIGHHGQFVTVIPSAKLVVVRLGLTRKSGVWEHDVFIRKILKKIE